MDKFSRYFQNKMLQMNTNLTRQSTVMGHITQLTNRSTRCRIRPEIGVAQCGFFSKYMNKKCNFHDIRMLLEQARAVRKNLYLFLSLHKFIL